jgi:hypothetical protein
MQAGAAIGPGTARPVISGYLLKMSVCQIRMTGGDRAVDESDPDIGTAAGTLHQPGELDEFGRAQHFLLNLKL